MGKDNTDTNENAQPGKDGIPGLSIIQPLKRICKKNIDKSKKPPTSELEYPIF